MHPAARTGRLLLFLLGTAISQAAPLTREAVEADTLRGYAGPSVRGVDVGTLTGKLMCGYQGWFNAEGDGAERGFVHWTKRRGPLAAGNAKIDLWPDVSEFAPEEKFATGFRHADGRAAEVFSSFKRPTVLRHFQWMREYGIDGAFVQRFIADLRDLPALRHNNTVLGHCREGANLHGRAFDDIPRLKGEFLWSQFVAARRAGATMLYVAMFDEVDEGTAIFKCTNDVPVGEGSKFLTIEGLPGDFYLRLAGTGARLIRGEIPVTEAVPATVPSPAESGKQDPSRPPRSGR